MKQSWSALELLVIIDKLSHQSDQTYAEASGSSAMIAKVIVKWGAYSGYVPFRS